MPSLATINHKPNATLDETFDTLDEANQSQIKGEAGKAK